MLFPRKRETPTFVPDTTQSKGHCHRSRISWLGDLRGRGGVRIEGTITGEIAISGLVVVGETEKVQAKELKADTVIVAGTVQGDIICQKLEIRASGKVWGDVVTTSFSSEDGAFSAGKCAWKNTSTPSPLFL